MKKLLLLPACLVGLILTVNAQVTKVKAPPPPPAPPKVVQSKPAATAPELREFYKKNPDIEKVYWKSEKELVIVQKDKKEFTYNMKNKDEKAAFKAKYGKGGLSTPPPAPPRVN